MIFVLRLDFHLAYDGMVIDSNSSHITHPLKVSSI